jgi:hypothetical protein
MRSATLCGCCLSFPMNMPSSQRNWRNRATFRLFFPPFLQISWLFAGDTVSEWWHRCWLCGIIFIKKKLKLTSIQGKIIYYFILFEKQIIKRDSSYISPQAIALFLQIGECKGTTKWREMLKRANTKRRK